MVIHSLIRRFCGWVGHPLFHRLERVLCRAGNRAYTDPAIRYDASYLIAGFVLPSFQVPLALARGT